MKTIDINYGGHKWEKKNLVTLSCKKGFYDIYCCDYCGAEGRSFSPGAIEVSERTFERKGRCPNITEFKVVKVTLCRAYGPAFSNLTPGSTHQIIAPPEGENNDRGVWVMGCGEPVLLLYGEFQFVEKGGAS